jgi:hypothetical protein
MRPFIVAMLFVACGGGDNRPVDAPVEDPPDAAVAPCPQTGCSCDPLDQDALEGPEPRAACGSTDPANPTLGCYGTEGFSEWTCAPSLDRTATDRVQPTGSMLFNSCAPGYQLILNESTASMTAVCTGFCAAGNISNDPAEIGNDTGVDAASAKLHDRPAPAVGDGLCEVGKKGSNSGGPQNCVYLWPFTVATNEPTIAPEYLDTLGICLSFQQYETNDDTPVPDCKTLPKRSANTPGDLDDAADWGCQSFAESLPEKPARRDIRLGLPPATLSAHAIVRY